ncbi:hypothetical protein NOVOSPHI9U_40756 [Novosphingobium sp. 9U]|nr:hypothetical protein NOVOSPHI9U_40756 [Novosphingobium sp. 9U]
MARCWVKMAPMLARTASTENGSAQSSIRMRPPAPTASPVRSMVPRLPGSRSACATSQIGAAARFSRARLVSNSANTPATACGFSLPVTLARISSSISMMSPPAAFTDASSSLSSGCDGRPLAMTRISGSRPHSRASVRRRRPSARNLPSRRRCFFSRKERRNLTVGLEKPVIVRRKGLVLAEAVLDEPGQLLECFLGTVPGDRDLNRIALGRTQHHQPQDRATGRFDTVLADGNGTRGRQFADHVDELGARPRVEAALVDDQHRFATGDHASCPKYSDAMVM